VWRTYLQHKNYNFIKFLLKNRAIPYNLTDEYLGKSGKSHRATQLRRLWIYRQRLLPALLADPLSCPALKVLQLP
jgi:hypothetical protein